MSNPFIYFAILGVSYIIIIILITLFYVKHKNNKMKEEIKKTFAELEEEAIKEEPKSDIESLLEKMQEDLESKDAVTNFEEDQEENAIISYQELVAAAKKKEKPVLKEEEKEVIDEKDKILESFGALETTNDEVYDEYEIDKSDVKPIETYEKPTKKFIETDFISPIYGKQKVDIKYPTVSEKKEVKQKNEEKMNDDFLNALKDLRRNL